MAAGQGSSQGEWELLVGTRALSLRCPQQGCLASVPAAPQSLRASQQYTQQAEALVGGSFQGMRGSGDPWISSPFRSFKSELILSGTRQQESTRTLD